MPEDLYAGMERYIRQNRQLGYTSVPEFVREQLRNVLRNNNAVRVPPQEIPA